MECLIGFQQAKLQQKQVEKQRHNIKCLGQLAF